jgi:hypothetical protein
MSELYLDCDTFVRYTEQKGYNLFLNRGFLCASLPEGKYHIFQIIRGRIIANSMDLQEIFREDTEISRTLLNEYVQPKNKTPHIDGFIYDGVTYHYAFEFKLAPIGKTINVVTSNFNQKKPG